MTRESKGPMKKASGQKSFLKYRSGKPLSPKEAIQAKCYDCQSFYIDFSRETKDCGVRGCPLYPYHPYSSDRSLNLLSLNAKKRALLGENPSKDEPLKTEEAENGAEKR